MAWSTPRTYTIGETVTAAMLNTQRDLLNSLWQGTTAGDIEYFLNSTNKTRLGIGSSGQVLQVSGGVPSWQNKTPLTTTGDLMYASSGATTNRLAIGSTGQVLTVSGGVPAWATPASTELVYRRQGGSATQWQTVGTTNYTPTGSKIQAGSVSVTLTGSGPAYGTVTVTFPVAFTHTPIIYLSLSASQSSGVWTQLEYYNISTSGCTIAVGQNANSSSYSPRTVNWMALGD